MQFQYCASGRLSAKAIREKQDLSVFNEKGETSVQIKLWIKSVASIAIVIMVLLGSVAVYAGPVSPITATDADSLQVDVNGNTKVNKGDTIRHTITIQNTGGTSATGTNFSETIDANTTLVGPVSASPVAANDTFPVIVVGNVSIDSSALSIPFSVTSNDYLGLNSTATISAYDSTTAQGGQIVMTTSGANMGRFTYNPPPGFEGTDTFTYTLIDNANAPSAIANRTATVSIPVSGMIWFIDNNSSACTTLAAGCGRLSSPFSSLAAFNTLNTGVGNNPAANDNIFIYESVTPYTGGVTLLAGQKLIGQDSTASLSTITGLTPPVGSATLPAMNTGGNAVTIQNAAGDGVFLGSNNTLRGFTAGNSVGWAISGTSFGTLSVSDVIVNTTGPGLYLFTGNANTTFTSFSSSGGTNNIFLMSVGGTTNLGIGALSGATGTAVAITGGSGFISYSGSVSKTSAGRLADIQTRTGGSITLSGTLTCNTSCTGINVASNTSGTVDFSGLKTFSTGANPAITLMNNTGSTINFLNGGMSVNTTSGGGFSATGGGTVTIQGIGNSITATTGTALNITNTNIGASGLNIQSISSNGGSNTGIILNNTGAAGGLNVPGNGVAGSGGTIANKTGADGSTTTGVGIYLNSTANVQLNWMQLNNFDNFAIRGFNVAGFSLGNTAINGTNGNNATIDSYGEGGVYFGNATTNGLTGTAIVDKCVINGGRARNFSVVNTAGSLNRLTITGTSFGLNQNFVDANQSLAVEARNSGTVVNVTVDGATGSGPNTFIGAPSDLANFTGQTLTTMDVIFRNNTLSNSHLQNNIGGGGLTLATQGSMTFNVDGNTMRDADGSAVTLFKANLGTLLSGRFTNNIIGNAGVVNSGSKSGNGVFVSASGIGTMAFTIANNQIHQINGNSHIYADNTDGSYTANFTITGNTLDTPGPNWFAGIAITNGAPTVVTDTINVCADIGSSSPPLQNTLNLGGNLGVIVGSSGAPAGHTFNLPGYAGGPVLANVESFILGRNAGSFVASAYEDAPATAAAFTGVGPICPTP